MISIDAPAAEVIEQPRPSGGRLIMYFIFSWLVATICTFSASGTFGLCIQDNGFSWTSVIVGLALTVLINGTGAFVLGTLTGPRYEARTIAIAYVVPAFLTWILIFVGEFLSEMVRHETLTNPARYIAFPILDLIVLAYASFCFVKWGMETAINFSRPNAALAIPWYHWLWILPFALFQTIAVPLFLALTLWRTDILAPIDDLFSAVLHFPALILRVIVVLILSGVIASIRSAYTALSKDVDSIGIRFIKVFGTWILLTAMASLIICSYVVQLLTLVQTTNKLEEQTQLYRNQGKYIEAEPVCKRLLAIQEKRFGPDSANLADTLDNLAVIYCKQGKYAEAEPLYKRAIKLDGTFGSNKELTTDISNLANVLNSLGKHVDVDDVQKKALSIRESVFERKAVRRQTDYASLLRKMGRESEAIKLESQAK